MEEQKLSPDPENRQIHEESSTRPPFCRICYDIEKEQNLLIHPCRCTGSVKHVHEECLKTWLLSTNDDLSDRSCELCQTKFQMDYKLTSYISLKESCDRTLANCFLIPILLSILSLIIVIIYFLYVKYSSPNASQDEKSYSIVLIIGCSIAGAAVLVILVYIVKSTLVKVKMDDWRIKDQDFYVEIEGKNEDERGVMTSENEVGGFIAVNKVVNVKGKKIKAPKVMPLSLVPVFEGMRIVGYKNEGWQKNVISCEVFSDSWKETGNSSEYIKHNSTL